MTTKRLLIASALLAACSNPPTTPDASDARTDSRTDATAQDTGVDTGSSDTGVITDSGVEIDSGADPGVVVDSGIDSGVVTDSGVAIDARTDSGVAADVADARTDSGVIAPDSGVIPPDGGPSARELWMLRVGVGAEALSNASTALFIERRSASDGAMRGANIALPTAASGANQPITLSGTATSEGALLRSTDGRFVTFAGYGTAPGLASVASSASTMVPRVVARVAGAGTVDTRTTLGTAYTGNNVRSAFTTDGSAFWIGGTGSPGGVHYQLLGATTEPVNVLAMPSNIRTVSIFEGQLFATASTSTPAPGWYGVLRVGSSAPTTAGASATLESGFSMTSGPSPYGFVAFDRSPSVTGVDVMYVADDRAPASGGGVQRWSRATSAGAWTLDATFNTGITAGVRGLAAWLEGTSVVLVAVTGENPSRVVRFDDVAGSMPGMAVVLATAAANTQYRGVALAPTP
ncbi:MAG: hypothetical protein JNK05_12985 [Myxococcales bacterium]|nr:hypothetical protein [Myxococcales bacterium]